MGMALALLACLYTKHDIHVTLDIRHIQETATNIEDVVSGEKKLEEIKPREGAALVVSPLWQLASLFDPSGVACAADSATQIREMTPALKKAIENRKERFSKIRNYKSVGAIGENNLALLEVRTTPLLDNPEEKKTIESLVSDENADRMVIYREIARQNNAAGEEGLKKIQLAWARVHRDKSEKDDWVQVPSDDALYASFLESEFAKKLDAKPKPGQWVQVP